MGLFLSTPHSALRTPHFRLLLALAGVGLGVGCDGAGPPPPGPPGAAARRPVRRVLTPPEGPAAAVAALAWGGPPTALRLGVRWVDGRFAVYRPERGPGPVSAGPAVPEAPARALAILAADRAVTGDAAGLTLWDIGAPRARPIARRAIGAVGALAVEPGGGDWLAGMADGRILRFRPRGDEPLGRLVGESRTTAPGAGVVALVWAAAGRDVVAIRANGRASRFHHDLVEVPEDLATAAAAAATRGPPRLALVVAGPALEIGDPRGSAPPRRFCLPRPATGLAFLREGAALVVAGDGQVLVLDPRAVGPGRFATVRVRDAPAGPTVVAAAGDEPFGGRLAIGDARGQVEVVDHDALIPLTRRWSFDEVADLAFQPGRRLYRPRPGAAGLDLPEGLGRGIEAARERLDRGEGAGLLGELRQLDAAPALNRAGAAEVAVLTAAARQAGGWPTPTILQALGQAQETFRLLGRADREADVRFWQGVLLAPSWEGAGGAGGRRAEEALEQLRRAAGLYRAGGKVLERQALVCEAVQAWVLLGRGDLPGAVAAFRPVTAAARADAVLAQAPELERTAAALAAARGDWEAAAEADARLLRRLEAGDRPGLRREATLAQLGALAALGRWDAAARLVADDVSDDPAWHLRRATVRARAGLPVHPPSERPEDQPRAAHVRGLLAAAAGRLEEAGAALARAGECHRLEGRDDLAAEADLERAEVLERLRRLDEALTLYEGVARQLRSGLADDRTGIAARPIRAAGARTYRGIARCQLALGRPAAALAALDRAALVRWFAQEGEAVARTAGPSPAFDPPALRLAEDEAALIFAAIGPETLVGFVARGSRPLEARLVPASRADLRRAVRAWRAGLGDGGRGLAPDEPPGLDGLLGLDPEPDPDGAATQRRWDAGPAEAFLNEVLVRPFESSLPGDGRLIVVPDDALGALPFERIGRDRPLGQRFRVAYAPMASVLHLLRGRPRAPLARGRDVLLFEAPGVRGGPEGLLALAEPYRSAGLVPRTVTGAEASPQRLLEETIASAAVIHLASAATLVPAWSPWGDVDLLLAPGDPAPRDDGRLTAGDLLQVPLRVRVVSLAVGRPSDRPGVSGPGLSDLARGWLAAGAEAVVLSLWDPPASSGPRFLAEFHRAVASGEPPARALDRARDAIASAPQFSDPVHWAGFVLYGSP